MPLGPAAGWPQELRFAVVAMLDSPYPVQLLWGPQRIRLYNDAFRRTLACRHPAGFGGPAAEAGEEAWAATEDACQRVLARGGSVLPKMEGLSVR